MPRFLDTRGLPTLTVAICDRCRMKMSVTALAPDPNAPGLMVCVDCRDVFDPWRLPARKPDQISVPASRPDEPLTDE